MAKIATEHLVKHLEMSGFVVMRKASAVPDRAE
jgi:hypothetical protein